MKKLSEEELDDWRSICENSYDLGEHAARWSNDDVGRLLSTIDTLKEELEEGAAFAMGNVEAVNVLHALLKEKDEEIERQGEIAALAIFDLTEIEKERGALKQKVEELEGWKIRAEIKERNCKDVEVANTNLQAKLKEYEAAMQYVPFKAIASLLDNTGHNEYATDLRRLAMVEKEG